MTDFAIPHETLEELRTKAILEMAEKLETLQAQLNQANERIRQLESQIYGGSTG